MKVVFDSNVYISGHLFKGGVPSRLVDLAHEKRFELYYSPEILEEIRVVLGKKFALSLHERTALLRWIESTGQIIYPQERIALIKNCDPDNRILECAVTARADFLVTGDKEHLLGLPHRFTFQIISPTDFYRVIMKLRR